MRFSIEYDDDADDDNVMVNLMRIIVWVSHYLFFEVDERSLRRYEMFMSHRKSTNSIHAQLYTVYVAF